MILGILIALLNCTGADSLQSVIEQKLIESGDGGVKTYFTRDLQDNQNFPDSMKVLSIGDCSTYMIYTPELLFTFDEQEYRDLLAKPDKQFSDFLYFLQDNDIIESWYRVYANDNNELLRIDRLGSDINVNFGEVLYSFFPDSIGRIEYMYNPSCGQLGTKTLYAKIDYDGHKPVGIHSFIKQREKE